MNKEGQFSLNKTEILGEAPQDGWELVGYNIAANQLGRIIEIAAQDIANTGALAPGFENAVIGSFRFYADPAFAPFAENEAVMTPMIEAAQRFEAAFEPFVKPFIKPQELIAS